MEDLLRDIAQEVHASAVSTRGASDVTGMAPDGDLQWRIDDVTETALLEACRRHALSVEVVSGGGRDSINAESGAEWLLIADPVDGSRSARAGMPMWCVSLALARAPGPKTIADVEHAVLIDAATGQAVCAARGVAGRRPPPDAARGGIFLEYCGCSGAAAGMLYADLLDEYWPRGAFVVNSSSWGVLRVASGQAEAYIHPAKKLYDEFGPLPMSGEESPKLKALLPYDVAAWHLIATTAGCIITDLDGTSLAGMDLCRIDADNQVSALVTRSVALHEELLTRVQGRIEIMHEARELAHPGLG